MISWIIALSSCGKKEEEVSVVEPIIMGSNTSLAVLAETILVDKLEVHHPPEASLPKSLLDTAEQTYIVIPKSTKDEAQPDWVIEMIDRGANTLSVSDMSPLSPTQTLTSLSDLIDELDNNDLLTPDILDQTELLSDELNTLSDRWAKAVIKIPKNSNLHVLDEELEELQSLLPSTLHLIKAAELAKQSGHTKTKVALIAKEPTQSITKELKSLEITPILFQAAPSPNISAILENLEDNTLAIEQLSEMIQKAFIEPTLKNFEQGMVGPAFNFCGGFHNTFLIWGGRAERDGILVCSWGCCVMPQVPTLVPGLFSGVL